MIRNDIANGIICFGRWGDLINLQDRVIAEEEEVLAPKIVKPKPAADVVVAAKGKNKWNSCTGFRSPSNTGHSCKNKSSRPNAFSPGEEKPAPETTESEPAAHVVVAANSKAGINGVHRL